ncbi:peptidoglycan DD-metalloendopeptidase family protein [Magnetococcales bacterium HHB-1]
MRYAPTPPRRKPRLALIGVIAFVSIAAIHQVLGADTRSSGASEYVRLILQGGDEPSSKAEKEPVRVEEMPTPDPTERRDLALLSSRPQPVSSQKEYLQQVLLSQQEPMTPKVENRTQPVKPILREVVAQVRSGDTFSKVLQRHGAPLKTAILAARSARPVFDVARKVKPGDRVKLYFDPKDRLSMLTYAVQDGRSLRLRVKKSGAFHAQLIRKDGQVAPVEKRRSPPAAVQIAKRYPPVAEPAPNPVRVLDRMKHRVAEGARSLMSFKKPKSSRSTGKVLPPQELFRRAPSKVETSVQRGDNLARLLFRQRVPLNTSMEVARSAKVVFDLARQLKPGRSVGLAFGSTGKLLGLRYPLAGDRIFWLTRQSAEDPFIARMEKKEYNIRLRTVTGIVEGSLYMAGRKAGLSQSLAVKLPGLFEWDVDFARDIRSGDRFTVVFEEMYHQQKKSRDGDIVAAEFINRGQTFRVARYTDPAGKTGYYDASGRNVQKMFIRAPVDFTRISSHFSLRRKHPVFGFTRAHKGIDYAAPTGTPIRTAGNGRVIFKGRKGSFGNLVLVRHNRKYTTAYAHMVRYAKGLSVGQRVRQGEVIGFVGSTGAATGPHLHYEVRVFNKQVNPLSVKLPSAESIPRRYMSRFRVKASRLFALLDNAGTSVASLRTRR